MTNAPPHGRTLGFLGATGVGVGAIVGGGILALAGVAFETTGPSAMLAFALNGGVALLTALSFSELAARFPQSGGTYTYARKVLSVETAFAVGWVVWFASVVAAVLYALGFAVFLVPVLQLVAEAAGVTPPGWLGGRFALVVYALGAVTAYSRGLERSSAGGGRWATVGKVVVLAVLVIGGLIALAREGPTAAELGARFRPFFADGATGLARAMGFTFIALQGFDLIAAVGGEVKDPERNVPRAMMASLGIALAVYLPLLFVIIAAGTGGVRVAELAAADPEILVAAAARNFLGAAGYWLVVVAGILAMLSALHANLLAASSFARTMGTDRTLPGRFGERSDRTGTPIAAIRLTAVTVAFVLLAVPDVAAAGAVSSLIFLGSFTVTHAIAYLARQRAGAAKGFRTPWFPAVPFVGGGACLALGLYQAVAVPSAGALAALWLGVGAIVYVVVLMPGARTVDAASEGLDPEMVRLRGRQPVVLVPIANPGSAETLVTVARTIAPPHVSRVQLLSVVPPPTRDTDEEFPREIRDAQALLGRSLRTALEVDLRPEALITIHDRPLDEIARVAEAVRCETVLLGVGRLEGALMTGPLETLLSQVDADVVILSAPSQWRPESVRSILAPSRGGTAQSPVRARLLGTLGRRERLDVTYLGVLPQGASASAEARAAKDLQRLARDEVGRHARAEIVRGDPVEEITRHAAGVDLLVLGLQPSVRDGQAFGRIVQEIADRASCPVVMISQRSSWAALRRTTAGVERRWGGRG